MRSDAKLGLDQTEGHTVCWSGDPEVVEMALSDSRWLMVLSEADDHKVLGYPPELVDSWFAATAVEYVLVEADGARLVTLGGRPLLVPDRPGRSPSCSRVSSARVPSG